jgi:signal transduction histidine kinase
MGRTNETDIKDSKLQSGDEFKEIFNQSPIGILFYDKKGNAINANKSALAIMDIPKLDDVLCINLFDNPFIKEMKNELFNEGIINFQVPLDLAIIKDFGFHYPTKNGVLFLDYTVSVTDSGYLVQIQDITERKRVEEELIKSHNILEEQVEERAAEIGEAYQDIKEEQIKLKESMANLGRSNKELKDFAYITSHDLQEPLRSIASYAQLIQRRYKGQLDSDADEFLDFMAGGAIRMKEMIQGLLDYSLISRAETEFVKTDMSDMLEKAISNMQYAIDESNAEITHGFLPTVNADPDQIVTVFENLIDNAIKFKKADESPRIHISVGTNKERYEWVFSVTDNGIGMEKQYTDRIFEVFKRLHPIGEYEGVGIGLAVVKRVIDRHGGRVWVESSFGVGSSFYFTLPITHAKS